MQSLEANIFSQGELISSNIMSMDIIKIANKIPYAQVVVSNGEGTSQNQSVFDLSNTECFKPGYEIELALSYQSNAKSFKGLVIKHAVKKTSQGEFLTIDIKDHALKLALKRTSAVFENKSDKDIITEIAEKHGIKVECREKTYLHKQIVQYYCTDWDFIVSRAEANGLLVLVDNGTLILKKPELGSSSTEISTIYEFEMEADLSSQFNEVESVSWDINKCEPTKVKNNNTFSLNDNHAISDFASQMGTETCTMVNGVYAEKEEMELWANAALIKNRLSMLRGRVSTDGSPKLMLGDTINISNSGAIFDGTTLITGIRHRINSKGWFTDIQCGLSPKWFSSSEGIMDSPAAGLLPGVNGLQVGIVEAFPADGDPEKFHRIKVRIPAIHEQESVIWARLLFPYAGENRGMFWIPEAGDEVVVGFFNDDPRHAVIIGSLHNGKAKPPLEFTDKNNNKGFITRNGIKMVFTDEENKEKLSITTPGGNTVLLEDENGIIIEDKNKNKVTMHDKGISLEDKNKNKVDTNDKGIKVEDANKNAFTFNNKGIEIKDLNGNTIALSSAGVEIKDKNGNKTVLEASGITIKSNAAVNVEGGAKVAVKGASVSLN